MNTNIKELFDGLNHLCETNEAFYFSEQDYNEKYIIRSYTYRLASWTEFQLPYAKDCRGTAFVLNKETGDWNLFCRAYQKFFNLGEGIEKKDYIKDNNPLYSFEKLDGSLILVGIVEDKLVAKSKTSINSDHAKKAQELINGNNKLTNFLKHEIKSGRTPVMELVGPFEFRIVLNYGKEELIYLGSVNQEEYLVNTVTNNLKEFEDNSGIRCATVDNFSWDELENIQETSEPNIEGFVVRTEVGFVKCKVKSYVHLHHVKDNVNNLKNLIGLILSDDLDDLMGMFQDDASTLTYITDTQDKIAKFFNHQVIEFIRLWDEFHNKYKKDRKKFAMEYAKKHPMFGSVMKAMNVEADEVEDFAEKAVKEYIEKTCNSLCKAKEFIADL